MMNAFKQRFRRARRYAALPEEQQRVLVAAAIWALVHRDGRLPGVRAVRRELPGIPGRVIRAGLERVGKRKRA